MQSIRTIVAIDDNAKFRSDVQLDLFDDSLENEALLRDYLFSVVAPGRSGVKSAADVSPVDLLNQLVECYSSGSENRFVTIANYGHGKSHLALVLANYFSKPVASSEVKQVIDKLDHALNDPARLSRYLDFKRNRGEFLVIRLRGDTPLNVREQFIPKLEQALREHASTANTHVPSWHAYAEQLLARLSDDEVRRANTAVQDERYDVVSLLSAVKQRRDVRDLVVKALTAAKNMAPNLDAELDLGKTMEWLADELCGDGKPLGGVLVLFDEFSMYVSRYAQRNVIGELQNLLNGISTRPGKLLFLAFAQQDPQTVADNAAVSEATRSSIKHELTRIVKRVALKTLLESVIDAYLRQRDTQWADFVLDRKIEGALSRATSVAYQAFADRYVEQLRWDHSRFFTVVTKGTFPLHPLTTSLLCNLKFSAADSVGDPRTVLGFVMDNLQAKRDQLAVVEDAPNWVYPVALVDYFENRISPQLHVGYQNARRRLAPQAGDDERNILKALYLYDAAQLNLRHEDQYEFLAEAAGLTYDQTTRILRSLHNDSVIRQDSTKKVYSLWPANVDPFKLEQVLRKRLEDAKFDQSVLSKLNDRLGTEFGYGALAMSVQWGHPDDWAAQQVVLPREFFTEITLRLLLARFEARTGKLEDGIRGLVIWLAARTDDDIRWFREEAPRLLDLLTSTGAPMPLIAMIPAQVTPDLLSAFQRRVALENMSQNERTDVGLTIYDHEAQQVQRLILGELKELIGELGNYRSVQRPNALFVAPLPYRAATGTIALATLDKVLIEMYRLAYVHAPREFFTQYRVATQGANKLREAVKLVAGILLRGKTTAQGDVVNGSPVGREVWRMLQSPKWGLLSGRNQLQAPADTHIQSAWKLFDEAFEVGAREVAVRKPLLTLLNPPYGYDYNTVTLVFSAWVGYHLTDIDLRIGNRIAQVNDLVTALEKGPRDFIANICVTNPVSLSRRDPGDAWRRCEAIIEQLQPGMLNVKQATDAVAVLATFAQDDRGNARHREDAESALQQLQSWLRDAKKYEEDVKKISQTAVSGERYAILLDTLNSLSDLPRPALIVSAPGAAELQLALQNRLTRVVALECAARTRPSTPDDVPLARRDLQRMRSALEAANQAPMVDAVDQALEQLNRASKRLIEAQEEERLRAEIAAISLDGNLPYLITMRERLAKVNGYSTDLTAEREKKLRLLERRIDYLTDVAVSSEAQVANLASLADAEQHRDNLLRLATSYAGTDYEAAVSAALERTKMLLGFFRTVQDIATRPIQDPSVEHELLHSLASLRSDYDGTLGPAQAQLLQNTTASIQQKAEVQRRNASDWLNSCVAEYQLGGNLNSLSKKLAAPPAFLSPSDRERLADLQAQVQDRIDGDVVLQVEQLFRQIANRTQQERCIAHLQQILAEAPTVETWWSQKV